MPIPPLDERGFLGIPDSRDGIPGHVAYGHLALVPAGLAEIFQRFVLDTPDSDHRQELWSGWMRLRSEIEAFEIPYHTWLGGSFLTTKTHPGDIDQCIVLEASDVGLLSTKAQADLGRLLSDPATHDRFHCHVFPITNYPVYHPRFVQSAVAYNYWTRVFGVDRSGKQVSMLIVSERGIHE